MDTFIDLGVLPELDLALGKKGITVPTPVQKSVLPILLGGESAFFQSETGTGKTLCYLLPAFARCLSASASASTPRALIVAPTHELASQIKNESSTLARDAGLSLKTTLFIGGAPIKRQCEALKEKPDIVVGGPSRLLELIRLKKLKTSGITFVTLDETDRMLAPEMRDELRELIAAMPRGTQYAACSATLSKYHASLLDGMIGNSRAGEESGETGEKTTKTDRAHRIRLIILPPEDVLKRNIAHWAFFSERRDKTDTLRKFLLAEKPEKALVFTAVAGQVENVVAQLQHRNIQCAGIYAKLGKAERKQAIDDFRAGRSKVLVTSDLAARGLDIPGITHVIQLDVNENEDFFVHRAGRTARAGKSGINAVFGDERELFALARIEKKLGIVVYPKELHSGKVRSPEIDDDEINKSTESQG